MSDVDEFFSLLARLEDETLDNSKLEGMSGLIERISGDYALREQFFERFSTLNDRKTKARIVETFNFVLGKFGEYERGLISLIDLEKLVIGGGGIGLLVGGILMLLAGGALALAAVGLGIFVVGVGLGAYIYTQIKKEQRSRAVANLKSFVVRLNQEL